MSIRTTAWVASATTASSGAFSWLTTCRGQASMIATGAAVEKKRGRARFVLERRNRSTLDLQISTGIFIGTDHTRREHEAGPRSRVEGRRVSAVRNLHREI